MRVAFTNHVKICFTIVKVLGMSTLATIAVLSDIVIRGRFGDGDIVLPSTTLPEASILPLPLILLLGFFMLSGAACVLKELYAEEMH